MKLTQLMCVAAFGLMLGAGAAWAASVTGSGSRANNKEGCDAAKANAVSQLPSGATVKRFTECRCQGQGMRRCTIGAEY